MLINSIIFWLFFIIVLLPYFTLLNSGRKQNVLLLLASYIFYGWADWRMAILLFIVTAIFYYLGNAIAHSIHERSKYASKLTAFGVILGVVLLLYFKYLNFFIEGFANLFSLIGLQTNYSTFKIVLPFGISFFTFKLISYLVEIRRGNISTATDFITFATYIAFFPTIMSGPIDRPNTFIPQLYHRRLINFGHVSEGLKRVLWGMFTKLCIADVLVSYTDAVFNNLSEHNISSILFATVLYSFQIYADFNGYSNMAIGVAQIMGIKVSENFNRPYFADSVTDFWRKWHITLSSWIRDYIYIPLGGNRKGKNRMYINQMVAMTLCGMWHGAALNFMVWGFLHGIALCAHKLWSQSILKHSRKYHPEGLRRAVSIILTFIIVSLAWQLFRINSLLDYSIIFSQMEKGFGNIALIDPRVFTVGLVSTAIMILKDSLNEFCHHRYFMSSNCTVVRLMTVIFLISYIILFGALEGKSFIYFQF